MGKLATGFAKCAASETGKGFCAQASSSGSLSALVTLSQLEGGDAEHPLQAQRWDHAGIHARSLEYRREP